MLVSKTAPTRGSGECKCCYAVVAVRDACVAFVGPGLRYNALELIRGAGVTLARL